MELSHDFTVPASVDDAWATFMDLERVGSCFPGATITSVDESGFAGTVKVKLGPIALQYAGSGQFIERDDTAHRAVIEAKGKDKRGNGTAGADRDVAARAVRGGHPDRRHDRPVDHRQAGAVRPRGHAGGLRQAAPAVRRVHREPVRRARRARARRRARADGCRWRATRGRDRVRRPAGLRRRGAGIRCRGSRRRRSLRRRRDRCARPRRRPRTTRSTWVRRCSRCSSRTMRRTPWPPWPGWCSAGCSAVAAPDRYHVAVSAQVVAPATTSAPTAGAGQR